jgi:hypothetical protein
MNTIKISYTTVEGKDTCIKTAVSILKSLPYPSIKTLISNVYEFQSILLGRISEMTSEILQLVDSSLDVMIDNYVDVLCREIITNNKHTISADKIDSFRAIINSISKSAETYMGKLQSIYDLQPGELTLSSNGTKTERDLVQSENYSQDIFYFIQSKNLMNTTLSALQYDADKTDKLLGLESTTYFTFVNKTKDIIQRYMDILQDIINMDNQTQQMIDACNLSMFIWNNICNANKEKLIIFLDRKYDEIKSDVLPHIE